MPYYLPKDENNLSTLLIRTPYNKDDVFNQGYAHPSWYVSKGYAVVCQDVRGRWKSEGQFYPFLNEYSDGTLIIYNSNFNEISKVHFKDVFPVSLSTIQFDATAGDINYVTATVTFKYSIYNIEVMT